jgi:MoaA/NifB/PqqE/SkfB family radical SAM enzyme
MIDKVDNIGFYTLTTARIERVRKALEAVNTPNFDYRELRNIAPLWRTETLITTLCNFKCSYCRGETSWFNGGHVPVEKIKFIIDTFANEYVEFMRFSGGEPTIHPNFINILRYARLKRYPNGSRLKVAISSNGSASRDIYEKCVNEDLVYDWSISLDGCCAEDIELIAGRSNVGDKVLSNLKFLCDSGVYVTVGIVLTETNISSAMKTIKLAYDIGVSDIRIISSAQWNKLLIECIDIPQYILDKYPILRYRINNIKNGINVRGIKDTDFQHCNLLVDDTIITYGNNKIYQLPCIIAAREGISPIAELDKDFRQKSILWAKNINVHKIKICRDNCLDVCIDYMNAIEAS